MQAKKWETYHLDKISQKLPRRSFFKLRMLDYQGKENDLTKV